MTLANMRQNGVRMVTATCANCDRQADSAAEEPRLTAEERKLIRVLEKDRDQPMTRQEISLSLEQARALGVID